MAKVATTLSLVVAINIKKHSRYLQIWYKVGGALRRVPKLWGTAARLWTEEYVGFSTNSLIGHDMLIYTKPVDSTRSAFRLFISHWARFMLYHRIEPRERCSICCRYSRHEEGVVGVNLGEINWRHGSIHDSIPALSITPRAGTKALRTFKSAMSIMSENSSSKLKDSENGVDRVGRSRMITQFYFAMEIRVGKTFIRYQVSFFHRGRKGSRDNG